jgi:hypothetical protein
MRRYRILLVYPSYPCRGHEIEHLEKSATADIEVKGFYPSPAALLLLFEGYEGQAQAPNADSS